MLPCSMFSGRSPKTGKKVGERHKWSGEKWGEGECIYCNRTLQEVLKAPIRRPTSIFTEEAHLYMLSKKDGFGEALLNTISWSPEDCWHKARLCWPQSYKQMQVTYDVVKITVTASRGQRRWKMAITRREQ